MTTSSTSPQSSATASQLSPLEFTSSHTTPPNSDTERASISSSEYSPIEELSFDYTFDADGKYVRLAKSSRASPPQSQDEDDDLGSGARDDEPVAPTQKQRAKATLEPSDGSGSFPRSKNSRPVERVVLASNSPLASLRPTQRVVSGTSSLTPAAASSSTHRQTLPIASGSIRKIDRPQRVTLQEFREQEERNRKQVEELKARMEDEMRRSKMEEKDLMIADGEVVPPRDNQRHYHPSQFGSSRPLSGAAASSSSSHLAFARAPRVVSTSTGNRPNLDAGLERDRERPNLRQGPNQPGRMMMMGLQSSASGPGWPSASELDNVESDHFYDHGRFDFSDVNWAGEERAPGSLQSKLFVSVAPPCSY